jgi:hypothetical protein
MSDISPAPRFSGRVIALAGIDYTIAPINVRDLKRLRPKIDSLIALTGMPTLEQWDDIFEILLAAVQRNNPEMTTGQLEGLVDLGNFAELISSVMGSPKAPVAAGSTS